MKHCPTCHFIYTLSTTKHWYLHSFRQVIRKSCCISGRASSAKWKASNTVTAQVQHGICDTTQYACAVLQIWTRYIIVYPSNKTVSVTKVHCWLKIILMMIMSETTISSVNLWSVANKLCNICIELKRTSLKAYITITLEGPSAKGIIAHPTRMFHTAVQQTHNPPRCGKCGEAQQLLICAHRSLLSVSA